MIDPSMPVRVIRNWKRGCYSILQGGLIKASAKQVRLVDVEFRVRESGRQRMLREGRKNVHAYAVGRLVDHVHPDDARELAALSGRTVFYDPRRYATFVDGETRDPVLRAALVQLEERAVIYRDRDAEGSPAPFRPLPAAA